MSDRERWERYDSARRSGDPVATRQAAGEYVGGHLGFLTNYAHEKGFSTWGQEETRRYLHELVARALEVLPAYDPDRPGHEGRTATFPTYVKRYLQDVAWKLRALEDEQFRIGKTQLRLRAEVQGIWRALHQERGTEPTVEEVSAIVTARHRRTVSPSRVRDLLDTPLVVSGDQEASVGGSDGDDGRKALWALIPTQAPSPEDQMVRAEEASEQSAAVTAILASLVLSPLEHALVVDRMMADDPADHLELAHRFQLVPAVIVAQPLPGFDRDVDQAAAELAADRAGIRRVRQAETALQRRLATVLADLNPYR